MGKFSNCNVTFVSLRISMVAQFRTQFKCTVIRNVPSLEINNQRYTKKGMRKYIRKTNQKNNTTKARYTEWKNFDKP